MGPRLRSSTLHHLHSWKASASVFLLLSVNESWSKITDLCHHSDSPPKNTTFSLTHIFPQRWNTKLSSPCFIYYTILSLLYHFIKLLRARIRTGKEEMLFNTSGTWSMWRVIKYELLYLLLIFAMQKQEFEVFFVFLQELMGWLVP